MAELLEARQAPVTGRKGVPVTVVLALLLLAMLAVFAIAGDAITPHDPNQQDLLHSEALPGTDHWAGTDLLGRDVASRAMVGARTAIVGALVVAVGAFSIATVLGLVSGYRGGAADAVVMRSADLLLALPALLIAIVVVGILGGGFWVAILVLIVLFAAPDTRIVRGAVLEQRSLPYVEAARTLGISKTRIMFGHILPNVLPIILAYVVLDFAFALVSLAGLSFLGLGVEAGSADWGQMLEENRAILTSNPWATIVPALLIILTAGAMNLVGDWMYDRVSAES
jgi:peptide/nickel transport system permease protein